MTEGCINEFQSYLRNEEKAEATISKYLHDVKEMLVFIEEMDLNKESLIEYRKYLSSQYKPQTVNGKLSAINAFLKFKDLLELKVKFLKVQKRVYVDEKRELTEQDFKRLIAAADRNGNKQLYYLMMVLYGTGIRISELPFVTVEAIETGRAEISMKGKYRVIIFPKNLVRLLKEYTKVSNIRQGCIFRTRSGRNLDRSNIYHSMKRLCRDAQVQPSKVFPHNFRHLFAKCFYSIEKNLSHLADILGHSSIETTRIYVAASIKQYEKIMDKMRIEVDKQKPQNNYSVVPPSKERPQNNYSVVLSSYTI
ncbi:tyrosine-type recombinase/integrase [Enterocloster hominis (ex Hitch et al. 2024)]|uniref:Tyrosine-type recombinase/integrase n=1 Tax=Enterocloster hominis (ex Hitch et al. 2024) TaxID=1917870 RepID=A0ABV1D0J3_9FIRM